MPPTPHRPGDSLLRAGAILLGLGVVASVVTLVPFLAGAEPLPLAAYLLSLLAPLGLGLLLVGLWRRARSRRRRLDAARAAMVSGHIVHSMGAENVAPE